MYAGEWQWAGDGGSRGSSWVFGQPLLDVLPFDHVESRRLGLIQRRMGAAAVMAIQADVLAILLAYDGDCDAKLGDGVVLPAR